MDQSDPSNPLAYTEYTPSSCNLFVNYLPPRVRDAELYSLFAPFGTVETYKVMMDRATNQSRCFGFVKFSNNEEARKAITSLNGCKMENKTLVVRFANAQTSTTNVKGTPSSNVYVKYLPITMTEPELHQLFAPYGNVEETKILIDINTNLSRGVGFIRFTSVQDAENALALDGCMLQGSLRPLAVRYADTDEEKAERKIKAAKKMKQIRYNPYQQPIYTVYPPSTYSPNMYPNPYGISSVPVYPPAVPAPAYPAQERTLFVYNVPQEADDTMLYRIFGPYGAIEDIKVVRDPSTNKPKGFAFVNMMRHEDALNAIQSLNGFVCGDKLLQVSFKRK